jgi:hypothetical protein
LSWVLGFAPDLARHAAKVICRVRQNGREAELVLNPINLQIDDEKIAIASPMV